MDENHVKSTGEQSPDHEETSQRMEPGKTGSVAGLVALIVLVGALFFGLVSVIYIHARIERTRIAYEIAVQLQLHRRLSLVKAAYDLETTFMANEATPLDGEWEEPSPSRVVTVTGR